MGKNQKNNRKTEALSLAKHLYPQQKNRLLAIASRHSNTPQDAEEALQDTFALFIDHFDPKKGAPPIAWLTLTLKRRCWATNHYQTPLQENTKTNPTESPPLPHEQAERHEETQNIRNALKSLKPQEKTAITLLALGYSYHEICNITGWTYTKVNRCLTEGRAQLRAQK